jgi:plasmid stability protein
MWHTCEYAENMPTMIQIRNVPDGLHRRLKSRASLEGLSLSGYLLREIEEVASRPTARELAKRLAKRTPVKYATSPSEVLREERDRL